ncbi:cytochrome B561 [Endozoicomonas montiporae]|uniref:Cytochrome B561 n=2 Tax=Endozoicomonas montiporae TaxID=1027273 RepID=A0A081N1F0_9GAMM|nr:cytochrome b [Endozoicomonas montiporae]AMO58800.1 cytochrome b561 [Endozoicomonas montiporae CL-33]KEQ12273.1 cytochrome B561 [Endozoicomonas montiporae]
MGIWKNTTTHYGLVSILIHWVSAFTVFSLFGVGLYMMSLSYYDPLYQSLPWWHKSIGLTLFATTLFRLLWKIIYPQPAPLPEHNLLTVRLAVSVHHLIYLLLFAIMISGYLISTADGRPVSFFGWFEIPALVSGISGQEDIAGEVHFYLAWALVILASLHGLAAIKHHLIDRDRTLTRMLKPR